jgi:predicted secreted Zn-dependent protease
MKGWNKGVKHNSGTGNPNAKLTDDVVRQIRRIRATLGPYCRKVRKSHPASLHSLAKQFGLKPSQVSKVALGRAWSHVR